MIAGKVRQLRGSRRRRRRFDEVYNSSFSRIYSYCYRRTRVHEDTEDAVAETFLIAWRRFDELTAADSPIAWLYGVARRVLANQRKLLERNERTAKRASALAPQMVLDNPEQDTLHVLDLEHVLDAMSDMSEADQELLVLAALEQLSYAEIASVVAIPVQTAKSRIYRARRRLQDLLEHREPPIRLPIALEGDAPHV